MDIVEKWKGFEILADTSSKSDNLAEKFLAEGSRFENAWKEYDDSKNQSGMLELMEAEQFARKIIAAPEV